MWVLAIGYFVSEFNVLLGINNDFLLPADRYDLCRAIRITRVVYQPSTAGC